MIILLSFSSFNEKTANFSIPSKTNFFPPSTPSHSLLISSLYIITANLDDKFSNESIGILSSSLFSFGIYSPWIKIFSHVTFSSLNDVTIDFAFPPLLLLSKFEAKVTTAFE